MDQFRKDYFQQLLPKPIVSCCKFVFKTGRTLNHYTVDKYLLLTRDKKYKTVLARIKEKKEPVNVVFLSLYSSIWKYDSIYELMSKDFRFHPIVAVCPVVDKGKEHMLETFNRSIMFFRSKGYETAPLYDIENDSYINLDTLAPDIIFYTEPYNIQIKDCYYIRKTISDCLTCYVNYGYSQFTFSWECSIFHKLLWTYFCEAKEIKKDFEDRFGLNNQVATGYPLYDSFAFGPKESEIWKIKDPAFKKVIWAPHHSISKPKTEEDLSCSSFLLNAHYMVEIAKKYSDRIQFVFKPHPKLKHTLYNHPDWGKEKTDAYYKLWNEMPNTTYHTGEYIGLFNSSDALIHDCCSFFVEYLYTGKPLLYTSTTLNEKYLGAVGKIAFHCQYFSKNNNEIADFIDTVVLMSIDPKKNDRIDFFNDKLKPKHTKTVAEAMLNHLVDAIFEKKDL